jgi:hypothetical protein
MLPHPGTIVMVADNDAGGITTYTATGAQFDFHAVTTRSHAEAIFHDLLGGLAERLRAPFVEVRRPVGWIMRSK